MTSLRLSVLWIALVASSAAQASSAEGLPSLLFADERASAPAAWPTLTDLPGLLRSRDAVLDSAPLSRAPLVRAALFPDLDVTLVATRRLARGPEDFSWFGTVTCTISGVIF